MLQNKKLHHLNILYQWLQHSVRLVIIVGVGVASLSLTGCNKSNNTELGSAKVTILTNEVIVDKSFIYSGTPERYQPSYNLRGTLAPIDQVTIASPYNGHGLQLLVSKGDWVDNGQALAHLQSELDSYVASSAKHNNVDILTDKYISLAEPSFKESVEATIEDVIGEALPEGIERYDADDSAALTYSESATTAPKSNSNASKSEAAKNEIPKTKSDTKPSLEAKLNADPKAAQATNKEVVSLQKSDSTIKQSAKTEHNVPLEQSASTKVQTGSTKIKNGSNNMQTATSVQRASSQQLAKEERGTHVTKSKANIPSTSTDSATALSQSNSKAGVEPVKPAKVAASLTFRSPIDGEVIDIVEEIVKSDSLASRTPFMTIADTRQLQLISTLPLMTGSQSTKSQLSVGQSVNFKIYDAHTEFTGQISHITPEPHKGYLTVRAPVIPNAQNKAVLEYGMQALMTIEYGQIELGVRVPREALHDADLTGLNQKYTRPVSTISAYVWVIEQNHRLNYTAVDVIQYFPESDSFLVHGINNDSLICTANLPKDSDGKMLSID